MKWSLLKNKTGSLRRGISASRKSWLASSAVLGLVIALAVSFMVPGNSYAGIANNDLLLIGQHCHDLHDITYDFGMGGNASQCHSDKTGEHPNGGWEEVMNDNLGCSSGMFYKHDFLDPHDKSVVTKSLWYTKQADYKDCYEKAQTMYNAMSGGDCKLTKNGSDNYNKCTGYQDKLHETLGCDSSMFQSANSNGKPDPNGNYAIIKPGASDDCQNRIDAVGAVHVIVIGSDGKPQPNSDPISSSKVSDAAGTDGGGSADSLALGCDTSSNPLTWILCPIINDVMVPAISATDNLITQQMVIPAQDIFCTNSDTCDAYYTAWASFRNISLGLLVIAGLIVVIAQAIGMEILDAYTIRKMLPRILIAAIAITLSWPLMQFAVTLSNNLGFGVRQLIIAPFHNLSSTINFNITGNFITNFFAGGAGVAVGVPIWIAAGGIGVLLSYVATAGLAVLVAILVLVLRQIAIIMLVLIAPVALIAYVLPNTQRVFRLWWESFIRALMMFPLIAAFIAAGRVFAAISLTDSSSAGAGAIVHGLIGFIAYFGPYFAIPMTFSMSGAMMGGLGNMINQRAQGVQGALGNYRKGQMQRRVARARAEGLYRNGFGKFKFRPGGKQRSVGHMLNTAGFWGLNADEMIPYKLGTTNAGRAIDGKRGIPGFRRGGQALESQIKRARRDQTVKAVQDLDIGYKSGRLMGGQYQYYEGGLTAAGQKKLYENFAEVDKEGNLQGFRAPENWGERQKLAEIFTTMAKAPGQIDPTTGKEYSTADIQQGNEAREAGGELKGVASEFEKYTTDPETNRVDGRMLGMLSAAKAGRLEMSDVVNNHNQLLDSGDQEQAIRETTLLQDALTPKRVSAARGHSLWWDKNGRAHSSYEDPTSLKAQTSLMRINTQELAAGKSEDIDALRETIVAGASVYKMKYNKETKKVEPVIDKKTGQRVLKDPRTAEGQRVKEVQNRIKTLAMYNSGDSDVGRKIRDIYVDRLKLPEGDLEWGRGGVADERERDLAGLGQAPLDHGDQGGGPGTPP